MRPISDSVISSPPIRRPCHQNKLRSSASIQPLASGRRMRHHASESSGRGRLDNKHCLVRFLPPLCGLCECEGRVLRQQLMTQSHDRNAAREDDRRRKWPAMTSKLNDNKSDKLSRKTPQRPLSLQFAQLCYQHSDPVAETGTLMASRLLFW